MQRGKGHKAWIEVSESALVNNISGVRKIVNKNTKVASVVKANAYGHGIIEVSKAIENYTDWFAVDSAGEAFELRSVGIKKLILVLGYVTNRSLKKLIEENISFVIYDRKIINQIKALGLSTPANVHLKIETGLNRQGVKLADAVKLAKEIKKSDKIKLEGLCTHFADVEDTLDPYFANHQLKQFDNTIGKLAESGIKPRLIHTAATAAVILHKKSHFNMIRFGIGLYGLWPSREAQIADNLSSKAKINLIPVMEFKSVIAQVKHVKAGESVGYGRMWFAPKKSTIAVVPLGYFDGLDRKLSNIGQVLINGKYAQIVGRIAMNMIMVDVTHIKNVKKNDVVTIIGKSGNKEIKVEEIAGLIGTIKYEVISRINPLIPRVVV